MKKQDIHAVALHFDGGFTLIELLIYMGIFSILLLILTKMFTAIIDVHLESQATSSVSQDGNYIMTRLSSDIRKAKTVVLPAPGTQDTQLHIKASGFDETFQIITQNGNKNLVLNN